MQFSHPYSIDSLEMMLFLSRCCHEKIVLIVNCVLIILDMKILIFLINTNITQNNNMEQNIYIFNIFIV